MNRVMSIQPFSKVNDVSVIPFLQTLVCHVEKRAAAMKSSNDPGETSYSNEPVFCRLVWTVSAVLRSARISFDWMLVISGVHDSPVIRTVFMVGVVGVVGVID
jgi:hypothetical protein